MRGHAEVVHRRADEHAVCSEEFFERDLSQADVGLQCLVDQRALRCRQVCCRRMADRRGGEVETSDADARVVASERR